MCPKKCVVSLTLHKIPSLRNSINVLNMDMDYFLELDEVHQKLGSIILPLSFLYQFDSILTLFNLCSVAHTCCVITRKIALLLMLFKA